MTIGGQTAKYMYDKIVNMTSDKWPVIELPELIPIPAVTLDKAVNTATSIEEEALRKLTIENDAAELENKQLSKSKSNPPEESEESKSEVPKSDEKKGGGGHILFTNEECFF